MLISDLHVELNTGKNMRKNKIKKRDAYQILKESKYEYGHLY